MMSTASILILLICNLFIGMLISWFFFREALTSANEKAKKLRTSLKGKDSRLKELMDATNKHELNLESLQETIVIKDNNMEEISEQVKDHIESMKKINQELAVSNKQLDDLKIKLEDREKSITLLKGQIERKDDYIEKLEVDLDKSNNEKRILTDRTDKSESRIEKIEETLQEKDEYIKRLREKLSNQESIAKDSLAQTETDEVTILRLKNELSALKQELDLLKAKMGYMQDDLTVIDGIGPSVSSLLRSAGITSFTHLAERDPLEIADILEAENPKYVKLIDTSKWKDQARIAANGNWEGLKDLQNEIKKNRKGHGALNRSNKYRAEEPEIVI